VDYDRSNLNVLVLEIVEGDGDSRRLSDRHPKVKTPFVGNSSKRMTRGDTCQISKLDFQGEYQSCWGKQSMLSVHRVNRMQQVTRTLLENGIVQIESAKQLL
jgi:hypothetical protein